VPTFIIVRPFRLYGIAIQVIILSDLESGLHQKFRELNSPAALVMPGDRERCLDAGANAYLSKPVSLQELSEVIEELLSNYRYEAIS